MFLSASAGRAVFNKYELWNYMNDYELRQRLKITGRTREELLSAAKKKYNEAVLDFTLAEKEKIKGYLAGKSAQFIKVNNIDNGWPYTIGDYIVLPTKILEEDIDDEKKFKEMITHELFHIYQRKNQKEFNKLYYSAGMNRVSVYNIKMKSPLLLNPDDEINIKWMIYMNNGDYVMPTLVVDESGRPVQKIILLELKDDGIYIEKFNWLFDESPYKNTVYDVYYKLATASQSNLSAVDLDKMGNNRHSPNEIIATIEESR